MGSVTRKKRVGRYELVHVLGEGGMGTVWLAHPHDAPDQLFAVKTVAPQYATDARVCTMFIKEASLAAAIDHPNIVRLYDVGIHDDVPFFVMEWIDGYSLREVARTVADRGRRVPPAIALRIASDLCAGLHAAHELRGEDGEPLGLVHRDVSPHNVLVTREGVAKLIDFGVAKARDLATGSDQSVCGGLKGKVRYMAPEQALEKTIDRRADLFSVGAVVYQLLTGRAPFEGPNELAIINALLSNNPVYVPEDLPEPVQWILKRAVTRRPEARFRDALEMQEAIDVALRELGETATHADVAACLAHFDPHEGEEEAPALASARNVRAQARSAPPPPVADAKPISQPPLAFETPGPMAPQTGTVAVRAPAGRANAGSIRFVLLAAGFVGALGVLAALLVREQPAQKTRATIEAPDPTMLAGQLTPPPEPKLAAPLPTNTPIIDMGDLEESKAEPSSSKPRRQRPPSAAAPPRATPPSPPRAVPPAPAPAPAKNTDIAGPLKVWK